MKNAARGFTLLEVIVAFAILALMMGPIMQAFSGGSAMTRRAADTAVALSLARSKMAELGSLIAVAAGQQEGRFPNTNFRWRLEISPLEPLDDKGFPLLYRVREIVSWTAPRSDRSVELVTVRSGEPQ